MFVFGLKKFWFFIAEMCVLCAPCVDSCAPANAEFLEGDKQKVA